MTLIEVTIFQDKGMDSKECESFTSNFKSKCLSPLRGGCVRRNAQNLHVGKVGYTHKGPKKTNFVIVR